MLHTGRALCWLAAALLITGCGAVKEDLGSMTEVFSIPTPAEAGRMMTDLNDADARRRGLLLISNSPFGNAEAQINWYRDRVTEERDPLVLAAAIRALARYGDAADAVLIAPHLQHDETQVRWEAAKGLQRLHEPQVVPALLQALRSEEEAADVRVATATALGQYPEDRVFQALVAALDHRELSINTAAADALATITGRDLGMDGQVWLAWYDATDTTQEAFADQRTYLFPTYTRDIGWVERLAFWSPKTFEQPAPPAGLRPVDEQRTYSDSDPLAAETGG